MARLARVIARSALVCLALLAAGCAALPGNAAPVVKIGVIAPFEGAGRSLGYAVLPVVKSAVAEANASGALGRYQVAVVAYNDSLDPEIAAEQARALVLDPEVMAVIGPFGESTAAQVGPVLRAADLAGIPVPTAGARSDDYSGEMAAAAAATRSALEALAGELRESTYPGRSGVARRLAASNIP